MYRKPKMLLEAIVEQDGLQLTYRVAAYSFDQGKLLIRLKHNKRFGYVPERFIKIVSIYQAADRVVTHRF